MPRVLLLSLLSLITACSSTYWNNRRLDLIDVAHIDVEGVGHGVTANVGPLSGGLFSFSQPYTTLNTDRIKFNPAGIMVSEIGPINNTPFIPF